MINYIQNTIAILDEPFMIRAIIAGILIAILCAIVGVWITLKKESFIADSISHASLAGVAIGLILIDQPLIFALLVAILMSLFVTYLKNSTALSSDNLLGIIYPFLFAIGIIVLSIDKGYKPDLETFIFGNLLFVNFSDIIAALIILGIVSLIIINKFREMTYMTFDKEAAKVNGINVELYEYIYGLLTALTVIVSVKLVGIVLVTALLVIPANSAKLMAKSFKQMIPLSIIHNIIAVIVGIFFSTNISPGATIIVISSTMLFIVIAFKKFKPN